MKLHIDQFGREVAPHKAEYVLKIDGEGNYSNIEECWVYQVKIPNALGIEVWYSKRQFRKAVPVNRNLTPKQEENRQAYKQIADFLEANAGEYSIEDIRQAVMPNASKATAQQRLTAAERQGYIARAKKGFYKARY